MKRFKVTLAAQTAGMVFVGLNAVSFVDVALAQTAASESSRGVEEIIVTATRSESSLQDVPVAITAIDGDTLKERNVITLRDVVALVPNFSFRDAGFNIQYNIRGSVSIQTSGFQEQPVSTYIDDVFLGSSQANEAGLFDLERVEVLRGPQGTLFGRNSTGGLVNFITAKPEDELGGYANALYGSDNRREVETAVNVPLSDALRTRLALRYVGRDNWQDNIGSGGGGFGSLDQLGARFSVEADVTPDLTALLQVQHNRNRDTQAASTGLGGTDPTTFVPGDGSSRTNCPLPSILAGQCLFATGAGAVLATTLPSADKQRASVDTGEIYRDLDFTNVTGKLTWNLGENTTLTSLTSAQDLEFLNYDEFDGTDIFLFGSDRGSASEQILQELRLNGTASAVEYVGGIFYLDAESRNTDGRIADLAVRQTRTTESFAVFANATVQITPEASIIVGGRQTWETKGIDARRPFNGPATATFVQEVEDDFFTYRLGAQYDLSDDVLLFATYSTGQKSGEFDTPNSATAVTNFFEPEKTWSFEVGEKATLFDRRLVLNASVFYQETEDYQFGFPAIDPVTNLPTTLNNPIDSYTSKGFEVETVLRPTDALELGATVGYNDTEIDDPSTRTQTVQNIVYTLDGNQMPGTPEWQVNTYARYSIALGDGMGTLDLQGEYQWQSDIFWDISNNPFAVEPSYGIANFRATWNSSSDRFTVGAFVNNAFDEEYATLRFWLAGFPLYITQWGNDPGRVAGVNAGVRF